MKLAYFKHVFETKGPFHAVERVGQIVWRFSFGRRRFERMLDSLEHNWDPEAKITFCVAASLLRRHQDLIGRLQALGHAIAAHGYYHSRMDILAPEHQRQILEKSHQAFRDAGIEVEGFRCPYLNYNYDTLEALQASPFSWTSQRLVFWQNGDRFKDLQRLFSLYHTQAASGSFSLPTRIGRLTEIPITAPDDEMFVERHRTRDKNLMREEWTEILHHTVERGELFHLLFHPERFFLVADALGAVLAEAKKIPGGAWFATLPQLARWWTARRQAQWLFEGPVVEGATAVIQPPADGVVQLVGRGCGPNGRAATPSWHRGGRLGFVLERPPYSAIGLPPAADTELEAFLQGEGFLCRRSAEPQKWAFYLADSTPGKEAERLKLLERLKNSEKPLLRLARWPEGKAIAVSVSSDIDSINLRDFIDRTLHF